MKLLFKKTSIFITLLMLFACIKQEDLNTLVPDTIVDFAVASASVPLDGGYHIEYGKGYNANGIVLFNYGQNIFRAFDLTCPTECLGTMSIDASGIMTCSTCDNEKLTFTQYETSVTIDETKYSLREYYATLEGGVVRITNF